MRGWRNNCEVQKAPARLGGARGWAPNAGGQRRGRGHGRGRSGLVQSVKLAFRLTPGTSADATIPRTPHRALDRAEAAAVRIQAHIRGLIAVCGLSRAAAIAYETALRAELSPAHVTAMLAEAQEKFRALDSDGDGSLSGVETLRLLSSLWSSFQPGGRRLSAGQEAAMGQNLLRWTHQNKDGLHGGRRGG